MSLSNVGQDVLHPLSPPKEVKHSQVVAHTLSSEHLKRTAQDRLLVLCDGRSVPGQVSTFLHLFFFKAKKAREHTVNSNKLLTWKQLLHSRKAPSRSTTVTNDVLSRTLRKLTVIKGRYFYTNFID